MRLSPPNAEAEPNDYGFSFLRFLTSPSYDQSRSLLHSFSFFGPAAYGLSPSFDFFAIPAPQVGAAKITFASNRDGRAQIYLMNADGGGQVRLAGGAGNDDSPRWSPSGAKILFQSDRDDTAGGNNDIYVMNKDGGAQTRLTTHPADDGAPSWSPDGSKVVFQSLRDGQRYQIYSMNADGSGQVNLSNSSGNDRQPSWSPHGSKIAFASDRDRPGYASVYVMNATGAGQQRLTFGSGDVVDEQPVWSRDGSKIAFVSTRDGNKEVYVMNADGTGQTRLTDDPGNDDSPYWSPDGAKLIFRSDRLRDCCDPTAQVWVMNADGTEPANLSGNQFGDYGASWTSGAGSQPPIAVAGGPYSGVTGQTTVFGGGGSFDPDGTVASYSWDFGDGSTGSGASPTHAYAAPGTYTVTLTVTDNLGAQASATTTATVSSSSSDQFVQNFLRWGLARQPSGDEGSYWADILRVAYPKGQTSMLLAMREFGMTVFESAEYAARGRSDHWYVYDLYKTYLMRDPDPQGWAWWEANLPAMGREQLRQAFEESIEFHNIIATLTASGSPSPSVSSLASARLDPFNQTGDPVRARDCEWGVTLLSLPGRAGLDLGLGLSYSSLVWTRSGPYAYFDEDRGSPSPGFRLGFARIQGPFFDAQTGRNSYVLIAGSGRRTGLRQVGASNIYEAGDSSYLQLIAGGGSLLLRATDGIQVAYAPYGKEWRATLIEDRNGNFISVSYDWRGDIINTTDTLGRVVTFNYDANANLSTITQVWQVNGVQQTHVWASFGWDTKSLQPGFASVAAVGAHAGEVIPVLSQVGLHNGSRYNFEYNAAGQAEAIRRHSPDGVERSRATYDYALLADDCPRVTATRVRADNWTGVNGVPAEVMTQYGVEGDGSHTMTAPDGTLYKDTYGTGWQRGLVIQSEVLAGDGRQRLDTILWAQDDVTVGYQTNPRVMETNVYDFMEGAQSNRRRTTIDYGLYAQHGLAHLVTEYAADGVAPLRQRYTDYNLARAYLDRRIIGLVSETRVYDPAAGKWLAKTTYAYDEQGGVQPQATTATSHDQSFDASFLTRGNLTSVSRWDAGDINNAAKTLTSRMTYDAAGSVLSSADPLGHENSVGYADSFSDGDNSRGTFAYPTTLTDADGFSSTLQYNFDFGARTRFQGPRPAGQQNGVIQTTAYDGAARVERVTTVNNGAYTRYVYGANYVETWSAVNTVADETYTNTVFDGMGHVLLTGSNNPGSDGGYRARAARYDLMGRLAEQSNPAETDGSWAPAGDDAAGWVYSQQSYDWKGRPRITTNTDGTQRSVTYDGCGCAGGQVAALTDEMGRQRKTYDDPLGRQWKTEILNRDGGVYSTTTNTFDALDRVTNVKVYQGPESSGVFQEGVTAYDGYGRLLSRRSPEQTAATIYAYNPDGTPSSVTDGRNATVTYGYNNNRHLVTSVSYIVPSPIPAPPPVAFTYDAAGNRASMSDGAGSTSYQYDGLSRLTSEARTISEPSVPEIHNRSFPLTYAYNLAGQLESITDPTGARVDYEYDRAGQMTRVAGAPFGADGVTEYAREMRYRAWGGLKSLAYGNDLALNVTYDLRLQPSQFKVDGRNPAFGAPTVMLAGYQYYADGAPRFTDNGVDDKFDRAYLFDHVGRLAEAYSGAEARGFVNGTAGGAQDGPYRQSYTYDVWGNMRARSGRYWTQADNYSDTFNTSNRNPDWDYDAAGHLTNDDKVTYTWDAAGRVTKRDGSRFHGAAYIYSYATYGYDGDGRVVRKSANEAVSYNIHSSVLGGVVTELTWSGVKTRTYVRAGGQAIAQQHGGGQHGSVEWAHVDPVTGSAQKTDKNGSRSSADEMDPMGASVGLEDPFDDPPPDDGGGVGGEPDVPALIAAPDLHRGQCTLDGVRMDCGYVFMLADMGVSAPCPNNRCGVQAMKGGGLGVVGFGPDAGRIGYWRWSQAGAAEVEGADDEGRGGAVVNARAGPLRPFFVPAVAAGQGLDIGLSLRNRGGSRGLQNPAERRLTTDEFAPILEELKKMLTAKCKEFIDNLVSFNTGTPYDSGKNLLDHIDATFKAPQAGVFYGPGQTRGRQKFGDLEGVNIGEWNSMRFYRPEQILFQTQAYASTFLHEIIHTLTKGSDDTLTNNLIALGITAFAADGKTPMKAETAKQKHEYWSSALRDACFPHVR